MTREQNGMHASFKRTERPRRFDRRVLDDKIRASVDVDFLRRASIVAVGSGGANGIYESFARLGIGKLTVVDFDHVDAGNLVTQGWYADQLGKPKVEALRDNVRRLLPSEDTVGGMLHHVRGDFLDMTERDLEDLAAPADLLMFMTDDFYAQARGNRLALKLRKPALFAMMYERARCCEVSFVIPGVTPACHRCATSSRYDAYLKAGYLNNVTSAGSTIFHTQAINSVIGMVAMAILHNDKPGYEFGGWFGPHWDRNLLQLRLSPRHESDLFKRVFGAPQAFCFDTVWQRIEPERPPKYAPCPDCGGTGDLRDAAITRTALA